MELNVGQRLALAIDMHLILDAGAGTGKTQSIVGRTIEHYLSVDQRATRLLPPGPRPLALSAGSLRIGLSEREDLAEWRGLLPSEVVVLTFTTRAAEEMRHRLWEELNRLRPGPTRDTGGKRRDSRVTHEGLIDQLTAMLEDAPIGTIDSFFSRLIAPWRADLSQRPTDEIISDAERHVLLEQALEGLWRLRSPGDAVAAGVSGERAPFLIESRDRLARRFGSRRDVRTVLSSLLSNRIFVDSVARRLETQGKVNESDVRRIIESIIAPSDNHFDAFVDQIHQACLDWVNHARTHGNDLKVANALVGGTRFQTLVDMVDVGPPATRWERWLWLHGLCMVTCTTSSHQSSKVSAFGGGNLSSSADWPRGIATWGSVSDANAKQLAKDLGSNIADIWNSAEGRSLRALARALHLLDDSTYSIPHMPYVQALQPNRIQSPLPHSPPNEKLAIGIAEEASHFQDMLLCHRSLLDILHELKVRQRVHEFDDIASLAADLLLARCPRIMRAEYPLEVVRVLDELPEESWRDDHILEALSMLEGLVEDPESGGLNAAEAKRLHLDLQTRYSRLRSIRARYRAFIIDEAQDNSAQQWRLLGRLWGPRTLPENHPVPDSPWQPTICCVGDRKQSIYAFRQAQVSGFVDFGNALRDINTHELHSIAALTRSPELRRQNAARDPRYSADGGFATAADLPESRSKAEAAWVRFDEPEEGSNSAVDSLARSQGHVELVVNYRTAAGLLNRMNEWWEDLFSPIHDRFPGDWYARPQALIPARAKAEGRFEWLLPASVPNSGHPDPELTNPLDPFSSGTSSEMENALITARIRALIDGKVTRVGEEIQPEQAPLSPGDILVLLPSRTNLGDLMARLEVAGIPATADKEGGLLLRPVIRPLLGLIQWIARPTSRHAAATVARSSLVGLNDGELQSFLLGAKLGENLIERLTTYLNEGPHHTLVENWHTSSQHGSVIETLSDTLNHSDLLIAHPRPSERNDAEQFLHLVETQSLEVGGDPILLADRISHLADVAGNDLTSAGQSSSDSVQIMTIHGSKGLQRKCVIVGGLFSEGQGNISHDLRQRVIATPSLFASNPRPWKSHSNLDSGIWTLARTLQEAQIQAEARRLFYVACTRVKDLLILAGGPNDSIHLGNTVSIKPRSVPMPTFGHMWFDALGWHPDENGRHIITPQLLPFAIHSRESELVENTQNISPLVRMSKLHEAAGIAYEEVSPAIREQAASRTRCCKISPHQLDKASACPRCYLQLLKLGISPSEIQTHVGTSSPSASEKIGLPPANVIGTIFHRVVEIGLETPEIKFELSTPLPSQWTQKSPDLLADENVIQSVLKELMPPDADEDALKSLLKQMSMAVKKGPLGTLTSGDIWNGELVEGLRTEWPFSLQIPVEMNADEHTWTPHGPHPIAHVEQFMFSVSGIADLVLCTKMEDGKGAIRAVDLKTTGAAHLYAGWPHPLLEAEGESRHPAEQDMLDEYRMQLALYTLALIHQEEARKRLDIPHRLVLPPAILCATTGRMIVMTESEQQTALEDLESLLETLAMLSLEGDIKQDCDCPLDLSNIRLFSTHETESA